MANKHVLGITIDINGNNSAADVRIINVELSKLDKTVKEAGNSSNDTAKKIDKVGKSSKGAAVSIELVDKVNRKTSVSSKSAYTNFIKFDTSIQKVGRSSVSSAQDIQKVSRATKQSASKFQSAKTKAFNYYKTLTQVSQSSKSTARNIQKLDRQVDKNAVSVKKLAKENDRAVASNNRLNQSTKSLFKRLFSVKGVLAGLGLSFASVNILSTADDYNVLQTRIQTATKVTQDYTAVSRELYNLSQENGAFLKTSTETFQGLSRIKKELGATNTQVLTLTSTVQKLGVIGGSSNEQMKNGLLQFNQSMAAGIVRAEEMNSIFENLPELGVRIAKGLGKTTGELQLAVRDGKVLSQDVFDVLLEQAPEIAKEFKNIPLSIGRANTILSNSISQFLGKLDEATGITSSVALGLQSLAGFFDAPDTINNLSELVQSAQSLLTLLLGFAAARFLGPMLQTMAISAVAMTRSFFTASIQTNTLGQVMTRTTVATRVLTGSVASLKAGLAFLGGPVGLAILAATAIFSFSSNASVASKQTIDFSANIKQLRGQFNQLRADNIESKIRSVNEAIADNNAELEKSKNAFKNNPKYMADYVTAYESKIDGLKKRHIELNSNLSDFQSLLDETNAKINQTETSKTSPALKKLNNELKEQLTTIGLTKSELLSYQTEIKLAGTKNKQAADEIRSLVEQVNLKRESIEAAQEATKLAKQADDEYSQSLTQLKDNLQPVLTANQSFTDSLKVIDSALAQNDISLKKSIQLKKLLNKSTLAARKPNQAFVKSLRDELKLIKLTDKQRAIEINLRKLSSSATAQQKKEVEELTAALYEQQKAGNLDKLVDDVDKLGDSWLKVGQNLEGAFGSVVDQINALAIQQKEYNKSLLSISKQRESIESDTSLSISQRADSLQQLSDAEKKLNQDNYQAKLGQISAISQATADSFKKGSKEAQAFTIVAQGLAVAQAIAAVANQGQGDPYTAFARIAAMIGTMSSLGLTVSGSASSSQSLSEQRQEAQGTGSILGDASKKSDSLLKAYERIESLELDQYAELVEMNRSLRDLNNNIFNLSAGLVKGFGDFSGAKGFGGADSLGLGETDSSLTNFMNNVGDVFGIADPLNIYSSIFGSTKKTLEDSGILFSIQTLGDILSDGIDALAFADIKSKKKKLFGLSSSTKFNTQTGGLNSQLTGQLTAIFQSLGDSVTSALDVIGLEAVNALDTFVVNIGKVSLKDLSGEDVQKELEAIFSQQADLMAQHVLPSISKYQQLGEGLFDTLVRVAQEQVIFNDSLERTGLVLSRFGDITAQMQLDIAQSIIQSIGGIEKFKDSQQKYFSSFFTAEEQFSYLTNSVKEQFSALGLVVPNTKNDFRELMQSLDLTSEAGQQTYASLLRLVPALATYYDELEKQEQAVIKFNQSIQSQLDEFDLSGVSLEIFNLNKEFQKYIDEALPGADIALLEQLYAKKREAIIESHLETVNEQFNKLADSIKSVGDSIGDAILNIKRGVSGFDEIGYQEGLIADLYSQLTVSNDTLTPPVITPVPPVFEVPTPIAPIYDVIRPPGEYAITPHPPNFDLFLDGVEIFIRDIQAISEDVEQVVDSVNTSIDVSKEISIIGQLKDAVVARYNAELSQINELRSAAVERQSEIQSELEEVQQTFDNAVLELEQNFAQLTDAIQSTQSAIEDSILSIQRSQNGWNEVTYQSGQISDFREQLGQGSVDDQITNINSLQQAITAKYQAEIAASENAQSIAENNYKKQIDAAKNAHNLQLSHFKKMSGLAKSLNSYLDSLQLSSKSYFTNQQRLDVSKSQYEALLAKAQGGDSEAISGLQKAADSYLKESQGFYASSQDYVDIFDKVNSDIGNVAKGINAVDPGTFDEVAHATNIEQYQSAQVALQEGTIEELQELETLLAELQQQAQNDLTNNIGNLTDNLSDDTAALMSELAAQTLIIEELDAQKITLQQSAINELQELNSLLSVLETLNEENRATAIADLQLSIEQQTIDLVSAIDNLGNQLNAPGDENETPVEPPVQIPIAPPPAAPAPAPNPPVIPPEFGSLDRVVKTLEKRMEQAEKERDESRKENANLIVITQQLNDRIERMAQAQKEQTTAIKQVVNKR